MNINNLAVKPVVMGEVKRIRSGSGIGDNLYLQSIVRHLVGLGAKLQVCTSYPELFQFDVSFDKFEKSKVDYVCHYVSGKSNPDTNQFQDMHRAIKIEHCELKLDWTVKNINLCNKIKAQAAGKPILFVHGGRAPMARTDGFGAELLPDERVFRYILDQLRSKYFTVYCGKGQKIFEFAVDLDLNDRTSVTDILDIASICDRFYGQCSFIIPLAESFDKKLLTLFSSKGFLSPREFIRKITPKKVLSKSSSTYVIDDWSTNQIDTVINAFYT